MLVTMYASDEARAKHLAYCKARYAANREKILQQQAEYRAANPDKVRESKRREYEKNRAKYIERAKAYQQERPEVNKAACQRYRKLHRERDNERCRKWRSENKDKRREIVRAWSKANPEKRNVHRENRRARQAGAEGAYTAKEAGAIRRMQGNKCAYCRSPLGRRAHLDHIIPLSAGGTNWPSNLQWLCVPCNLAKGAKDPIQFAQERGLLL